MLNVMFDCLSSNEKKKTIKPSVLYLAHVEDYLTGAGAYLNEPIQ